MIKRLFKVLLFPFVFLTIFIQLPYDLIKWVITGEGFEESIISKFIEW